MGTALDALVREAKRAERARIVLVMVRRANVETERERVELTRVLLEVVESVEASADDDGDTT